MTENHNTKSCKQRLVCRLCFELHQTEMHSCMKKKSNEDHDNAQLRKSEIDTLKCASVNEKLEAEVINMCIAAILVRHKKSRQIVKTCSMLDKFNQGPFIKEEIIEELRITGRKLKLILKTVTGKKSEELEAVNGLIVSNISCGKKGPVE